MATRDSRAILGMYCHELASPAEEGFLIRVSIAEEIVGPLSPRRKTDPSAGLLPVLPFRGARVSFSGSDAPGSMPQPKPEKGSSRRRHRTSQTALVHHRSR